MGEKRGGAAYNAVFGEEGIHFEHVGTDLDGVGEGVEGTLRAKAEPAAVRLDVDVLLLWGGGGERREGEQEEGFHHGGGGGSWCGASWRGRNQAGTRGGLYSQHLRCAIEVRFRKQ